MRETISEERVEKLGQDPGYFKLNLPASMENYFSGNGEGIWAVCSAEDKKKFDRDCSEGQFIAWAANDSVYFPGEVVYGSAILAEFRGEKRPVAVWDDLRGTKEAAQNRKEVMSKLSELPGEDV